MLMKVCVNGARNVESHPALSHDPEVLALECVRAVQAGAGAVHIHPKDDAGHESLRAADVDRWVKSVRRCCPGVPIGVTTGEWAMPDVEARVQEISQWRELPDFASVNWHEAGADAVAAALLRRGIGVEAGIWGTAGLEAWAASPSRGQCLRVLVEVQDMEPAKAREAGRALVMAVSREEPDLHVLLHGEERSTWSMIALAGSLGLDSRIGLEDSLTLPDGSPAAGNEELVQTALCIVADAKA